MSAQFVARVLSYCLGVGTLGLRGQKQRPWLEIIRPETEKPYLNHQIKLLREAHLGKLDTYWDMLPTDGFYDKFRLRVRSDELYRAYELMYPRDKKVITPQIISIVGMPGIAALWSDRGRVVGRLGKILTRWSDEENEHLAQYITQKGYECMATKGSGVRFSRTSTKELIDVLRPHTHRCMRSKFVKQPPRL